ncbi:MAG TPA: response regulator transcription factor [Prolixibacteraceae bacterium]|nr:response regulator transcription factor [Prolixibacteraceae bacterium]
MKILIADDHAIVREGVKLIVKTLPEVKVIDEASDGKEALAKLIKNNYDLAILDISMPEITGLDLLQKIKFHGIQTRVLMLSFHPQEQYAIRAFKLGASGYLSKDSAFEEMAMAIRKIAAGGKYVSAAFAEKLLFNEVSSTNDQLHESLSEREFQVMLMLAKGISVTQIASEIFISDKTVATYRSRIMEKMHMKKNAELTIYAIRSKLIE